jgi:hypothetical protein
VRQAEDYVQCAERHSVHYTHPTVVFAFYNGITAPLAAVLVHAGILVWGRHVEVSQRVQDKLHDLDSSFEDEDEEGEVTHEEFWFSPVNM